MVQTYISPGILIYLKPPGIPQKYDPGCDPQFMFGVSLMKGYCTDDDGSRLMKINELKPCQALPPGLYNKKRAEEAKKILKEDKYTYTRNFYNPNNLSYNYRFHLYVYPEQKKSPITSLQHTNPHFHKIHKSSVTSVINIQCFSFFI